MLKSEYCVLHDLNTYVFAAIIVMNLPKLGGFLLLFCTRLKGKRSSQFLINLEGNIKCHVYVLCISVHVTPINADLCLTV